MNIDRREALARLVAITGSIAIGAEFFLSGCERPGKRAVTPFTAADLALMDEIGDTIIPVTDSPGAKAAGIGAFMAKMVNDCYDQDAHAVFQYGLVEIEKASEKKHGKSFMTSSPAERTALLNDLDQEQRAYSRQKTREAPPHYFRLMKELTLLGFFSSEVGCTKALRYVETPGAYHGDVPYKRGDRAWFNPSRRIN